VKSKMSMFSAYRAGSADFGTTANQAELDVPLQDHLARCLAVSHGGVHDDRVGA